MKGKNDTPYPQFDWIGLIALLIGIEIPIRILEDTRINGVLLQSLLLICLLLLIVSVRRYDWKNIAIALLIICSVHPVRIIFHWWMNPIVFGIVTFICLFVLIYIIRKWGWKNDLTALLLFCFLLSGFQILVSTSEVGHCFVDDIRWTHYFYCETTHGQYQQIESLPIGMQGYCYYCPWYRGVSRW